MRVTRGDVVRLLPAGGSSWRVGKSGYGRQVETQYKKRHAALAMCQRYETTDRLRDLRRIFGDFEFVKSLGLKVTRC